jgi:hypothetical protein
MVKDVDRGKRGENEWVHGEEAYSFEGERM